MTELPKRIFKYVSSDRIDVLEKLLIRFTQPSCFNDPFEMRVSVDGHSPESLDKAEDEVNRGHFLQYALRGGKYSYEEFKKIQKSRNRKAMEKLKFDSDYRKLKSSTRAFENWNANVGILSLSAEEKNLLMWAHYADSHRGLLIEFDPKHVFFNQPVATPQEGEFDFGILTRVIYLQTRPKMHVEKTSPFETLPMLKTKSIEWEKEKEWRVYQYLEKRDEQTAIGNEVVFLFKLPPECVKRVVVGCNMDYQKRKRIVNVVKANPKFKGVKIEESVLNLDLFSLEYQPLPDLY